MSPPPIKAIGKKPLLVTADSNPSQPIKKLTPSCAYCRAKKIKCDTREPCNNCIAKGLEAECRKDERVPRGRKRSRQDKVSVQSEIAQLKSRLQDLQGLLPGLPSPTPGEASSSSQPVAEKHVSKKSRHDTAEWTRATTSSAPSSPLASRQARDADEASRTVEQWASTDQTSDADDNQGLGTSDLWRTDTTNPYWADSTNISMRVSINREASEHLPDTAIVDELVDLFFHRCNPLCGSIVYEPRFRRLAVRSCRKSGSTEHIMTSPLYIVSLHTRIEDREVVKDLLLTMFFAPSLSRILRAGQSCSCSSRLPSTSTRTSPMSPQKPFISSIGFDVSMERHGPIEFTITRDDAWHCKPVSASPARPLFKQPVSWSFELENPTPTFVSCYASPSARLKHWATIEWAVLLWQTKRCQKLGVERRPSSASGHSSVSEIGVLRYAMEPMRSSLNNPLLVPHSTCPTTTSSRE